MQTQTLELRTKNQSDQVALTGIRLRAHLAAMSQKVTVEQRFENREEHDIEAIYTFPLPEGAAVCGFEVLTGDRVLTGKVEEIEKASDEYDEAISEGHGAFMLEQDRPDVFSVRVGNLKPKQIALISLSYVAPLDLVDRSLRISYPTTIAPRYMSTAGMDPCDAAIDNEILNPPHLLEVPYGLSMEVDIDMGRTVRSITSPSHAIHVSSEGATNRLTLAENATAMDRDIVLQLDFDEEASPCCQTGLGPDGKTFAAVTFIPEFSEEDLETPQPSEVIFVLDCSGSMHGWSIQHAKRALELCLRGLSEGDTFNICRFGSTFEFMKSKPVAYSQASLDAALKYLNGIDADLGGTEIYGPLASLFASEVETGSMRQVILLTDGQVGNEDAVVGLAKQHRARHRFFTFGIGAAASSYLVGGLARVTQGASEFIANNERIEEKVLRTFGRLASPAILKVDVDWGAESIQAPAQLPPVFDGEAMSVFARYDAACPENVTLNVTTSAGERKWQVDLSQPSKDDEVIATNWARHTIRDMEEGDEALRSSSWRGRPSRETHHLVTISKTYGLLSRQTTFLAVEHRSAEDRNAGMPELRRVPVMLADGWHGMAAQRVDQVRGCIPESQAQRVKEVNHCESASMSPPPSGSPEHTCNNLSIPPSRDSLEGLLKSNMLLNSAHAERADFVTCVLGKQKADGAFEDLGVDLQLIDMDADSLDESRKILIRQLANIGIDEQSPSFELIMTTVLCVVLLRIFNHDKRDMWRRAAEKAIRFVTSKTGQSTDETKQWFDAVEQNVRETASVE